MVSVPTLAVDGLSVEFATHDKPFRAVDDVTLTIAPGEVVGVVGESGSGKSVTSLAIMGLVDKQGTVTADRIAFGDHDLLNITPRERRQIVGKQIAMIFQEPMTSLNPCYTVGFQIMESLRIHIGGTRAERRVRAGDLLHQVGIPDPQARLSNFPHQLSGGMSQRVMIAMALACNPSLLIADEPTTALDVTIQAQILDLLRDLQADRGMSLLLVTHDLAVVAEIAHRVVIMYAGQIVETGTIPQIFDHPRHPYTAALLEALPERAKVRGHLKTIPGVVPGPFDRPQGCLLSPRCQFATGLCHTQRPALTGPPAQATRCHTPLGPDGTPA